MYPAILLSLFLVSISANGQKVPDCGLWNLVRLLGDKSSAAIDAIEREWARAYAERDTSSVNCILADEFQITSPGDPNFQVHYKSDVLQWVAKRTGSAELEQLEVKLRNSAAAARGSYAVRSDGKLRFRFPFSDFFVYRDGRWQAVVRVLTELPVK